MAFILNSLLMTAVFQLFHFTKKYVGSKEGYIALIFYWIAFEYFHFNWESSWPWLALGNTFSITPSWVQWYEYSGVMGGTFWTLLVNLLVFRIYDNVYFKKETWRLQTPLIWLAGIGFSLPLVFSVYRYYSYIEVERPFDVVAVQHNVDPYNDKFNSSVYDQFDKILNLADSLCDENTDLLIAPETSLSVRIEEENFHLTSLHSYIKQAQKSLNNIPIYIGGFTTRYFDKWNSRASRQLLGGPGFVEHYNTSIYLNERPIPGYVHKSKLVPGVEKIPFSNHFPFLEDLSIDLGGGTGTLGVEERPKIFADEKVKFAPVICYESIFGEHIAQQCYEGAELICIITNDGWWGNTPGYRQHQSFASLRAIENRRSVARAANTGSSCFVNQRGDILQPTKWWVEAVIKEKLNLNSDLTFYSKNGDSLGRVSSFVSALLVLFSFVKWFREKFGGK
jgi:apolipoprotein N-acyltransferase